MGPDEKNGVNVNILKFSIQTKRINQYFFKTALMNNILQIYRYGVFILSPLKFCPYLAGATSGPEINIVESLGQCLVTSYNIIVIYY